MENIKHINSMSENYSLEFTDYSHSGLGTDAPRHHSHHSHHQPHRPAQHGGDWSDDDSFDDEGLSDEIDRIFQTDARSVRHQHHGGAMDFDSVDMEYVDPDYLFTDEFDAQRGGGVSSLERDFLGLYKKAEDYHHRLSQLDSDERKHHHSSSDQMGGALSDEMDSFSQDYDNLFMYGGKRTMDPKVVAKLKANTDLTAFIKAGLISKGIPYKHIQKISSLLYKAAAAQTKSEDPSVVLAKAKELSKGNLDSYIEQVKNAPPKPKKKKRSKKTE